MHKVRLITFALTLPCENTHTNTQARAHLASPPPHTQTLNLMKLHERFSYVHVHDVLGPEDGVVEGLRSGPRSNQVGREDIAVGLGVSTLIKRIPYG